MPGADASNMDSVCVYDNARISYPIVVVLNVISNSFPKVMSFHPLYFPIIPRV